MCPRGIRRCFVRSTLSDVGWRCVGEVGCSKVSQHAIEVVGNFKLVALLVLLGHSERFKDVKKINAAAQ
jgi:hypothetical protein